MMTLLSSAQEHYNRLRAWVVSPAAQPHLENALSTIMIGPLVHPGWASLDPDEYQRSVLMLCATPVPNGPTLFSRLLWGTLLSSRPENPEGGTSWIV